MNGSPITEGEWQRYAVRNQGKVKFSRCRWRWRPRLTALVEGHNGPPEGMDEGVQSVVQLVR